MTKLHLKYLLILDSFRAGYLFIYKYILDKQFNKLFREMYNILSRGEWNKLYFNVNFYLPKRLYFIGIYGLERGMQVQLAAALL